MKVLVACEESQAVCIAFRERGHEAYSCDLQPCSGGHPEWHICGDVLPLLDGFCSFITEGGVWTVIDSQWDLIIAHPPCTYLTVTGNRHFNVDRYGEKAIKRYKDRIDAAVFFMRFVAADCKRIVIENPIGIMGSSFRKADQIIQPYEFGDKARKATCLWLKGVQPLRPTEIVEPEIKFYKSKKGGLKSFSVDYGSGNKNSGKRRSKTYPGIAKAMAEQWG